MDSIKKILSGIFQSLNTAIVRCNARKAINPHNDPSKEYEVDLWLTISGRAYDFQSDYKRIYYDRLPTNEEKHRVRATLLSMLKSSNYSISRKTLIAYVCADIGIEESLEEIRRLRAEPSCRDAERFAFSLACEKLLQAQ